MIKVNFGPSIYVWVSLDYNFIYIGQTNNRLGIIARAYQHISEDGTLFSRVDSSVGISLYEVKDIYLLNFPLPDTRKYSNNESIYRLAVEYLVQKYIIEKRTEFKFSFKLISYVKSNDYVNKKEVIDIAENIVTSIINKVNLKMDKQ